MKNYILLKLKIENDQDSILKKNIAVMMFLNLLSLLIESKKIGLAKEIDYILSWVLDSETENEIYKGISKGLNSFAKSKGILQSIGYPVKSVKYLYGDTIKLKIKKISKLSKTSSDDIQYCKLSYSSNIRSLSFICKGEKLCLNENIYG